MCIDCAAYCWECYGSLSDVVQDGDQALEVVTEHRQYILLEGGMHFGFFLMGQKEKKIFKKRQIGFFP